MISLVDNRFSDLSPVVLVVGRGRGRFHQVTRRPWSSPVVVGRGRGRRQSISPGGRSPVVVLVDWCMIFMGFVIRLGRFNRQLHVETRS